MHASARRPVGISAVLGLCVCVLAPQAWAQTDLKGELEVSTGFEAGHASLERDTAFAQVGAALKPSFKLVPKWKLKLPLDARYRHSWLTPLSELAGGVVPELSYRPAKHWELGAEAGLKGTYRPGWLDQYQPRPDGSLSTTDRFSYWKLFGGPSARWGSFKRTRVKLSYELAKLNYLDDPNYDPNTAPTHLVPGDRLEHSARLDLHLRWGLLSLKPSLTVDYGLYSREHARDAGTGRTHAAPGGTPANPLLKLWDLNPSLRAELRLLKGDLTLTPSYGHRFQTDTYQGYYSMQGPEAGIAAEIQPAKDWSIDLDLSWEWQRYGSESYQASPPGSPLPPAHPPLEEGTRRTESRLELGVQVNRELFEDWVLFADSEWAKKSSNLPDYQPGIYPASRQYSIDWDYTNFAVTLGLRRNF